jgi:TPR repeat protein
MKKAKKIILVVMALGIVGLGCQVLQVDRLNAGREAFENDEIALALEKYKPLAWLGDSGAQYTLGWIYVIGGPGVAKDDAKAIYWFRRAARHVEKGEDPAAAAELDMAKSYADGINVDKKDMNESMKWLRLAAAGGNKEAIALLAKAEAEQKAAAQKPKGSE